MSRGARSCMCPMVGAFKLSRTIRENRLTCEFFRKLASNGWLKFLGASIRLVWLPKVAVPMVDAVLKGQGYGYS